MSAGDRPLIGSGGIIDPRNYSVDFVALVRRIGRGTALAIVTALVGMIVAAQRALEEIAEAIRISAESVVGELIRIPASSLPVAETVSEIEGFGIVALPAAVTVVLSMFLVIAIFVWLWGIS